MGRLLALILLAAGVTASPAEAPEGGPPDGLLVMGVVGRESDPSAVHGERAMVADPRTGEARTRVLPGGTLCGGPIHAAGDRVVYSSYRGAHGKALSLPLTLGGRPRSLGVADTIAPSATPGRLWLGRWARPRARRTAAALREVDPVSGAAGARVSGRLPRWGQVHAEVDGGFAIGSGNRLMLWDRALDRPLRSVRGAWPVAAGAGRVAFCGGRCSALGILGGPGERSFRAPAGLRLLGRSGAFSPDGRRLATAVSQGGRRRLAVVDLASGDWTLVPGGRLGLYEAMAWSPSGDWLYFAGAGQRLLGWRGDSPRAMRLPVDPGGTVMSIATTG